MFPQQCQWYQCTEKLTKGSHAVCCSTRNGAKYSKVRGKKAEQDNFKIDFKNRFKNMKIEVDTFMMA